VDDQHKVGSNSVPHRGHFHGRSDPHHTLTTIGHYQDTDREGKERKGRRGREGGEGKEEGKEEGKGRAGRLKSRVRE
jgi:hypothetical protein